MMSASEASTRPAVRERILHLFRLPITDTFYGLDHCLRGGYKDLARIAFGLLVGWWIYVPIHELLHAFACMATGGSVTRLEIDAIYGGHLLAGIFDWVSAGSDYAGQLVEFDTYGSDLIYLATVFGPYLLTLFPGVWFLRFAASRNDGLLFGLSLPLALAPFLGLTGDAYEIGSILTSRVPPFHQAPLPELLRGDDIFERYRNLPLDAPDSALLGLILCALLGALWALLTYATGGALAKFLGNPPVPDPRTVPPSDR
ncbi:MAG: hypothetical protein AAGD01_12680 [Acidobacteriota bacterium]